MWYIKPSIFILYVQLKWQWILFWIEFVLDSPKLEYDEILCSQKLRITNQWKIEVKFTGFPKPEVVWTKNGKSLASTKHCSIYYDEDASTIAIYSLSKVDTGIYTFTARNEAGSVSVDFSLKVIGKLSHFLINIL